MTTLKTNVRIFKAGSQYEERHAKVYYTEALDPVGDFALDLIKTHANVAGHEDGEDSTGRAKLRLQKPEELVARSFEIAELTFAMARERGHVLQIPDLNELNAEFDKTSEEERLDSLRRRLDKLAASKS